MKSERMSLSKLKIRMFYCLYHSISKKYFLKSTKIRRIQELMEIIQQRKYIDENGEIRIDECDNDYINYLEFQQLKSIVIRSSTPFNKIILENFKIEYKQSLKILNFKNVELQHIEYLENVILNRVCLMDWSITKDNLRFIKVNQLKYLNLSVNKLGSEGLKYIEKWNTSNMKYLNLSDNNLGSEGLKYIEKWDTSKMKELYLPDNKLGSEGLKYIEKWDTSNLKKLNLSWNDLGSEGLKYIEKWDITKLKHCDPSDLFKK